MLDEKNQGRGPFLVLATDLDGTFAGGSPGERVRLQTALRRLDDVVLLYVTGRTVEAARALMAEAPLPRPDILIADVGTTVVRGRDLAPIAPLAEALGRSWPGGEAVRERLRGVAGLEEQDVRAPRRVSYWVREGPVDSAVERAAARLEGLTVDVVGSAGVYLDVLPRGVNKGSTLRRVLEWLDLPAADVVVAGDTLNDLDLFRAGFKGIMVGNSEPALRERLAPAETVYAAAGHGAAGILEGLTHYGWLTDREEHHGQ